MPLPAWPSYLGDDTGLNSPRTESGRLMRDGDGASIWREMNSVAAKLLHGRGPLRSCPHSKPRSPRCFWNILSFIRDPFLVNLDYLFQRFKQKTTTETLLGPFLSFSYCGVSPTLFVFRGAGLGAGEVRCLFLGGLCVFFNY